jgi:hypothetical protein
MTIDPTTAATPARKGCSVAWALLLLGGASCLLFAISAPKLGYFSSRVHGNEAAAIGGLRTLCAAQSTFREADKDGDGVRDYGTLAELASCDLIDPALGAGEKQGYTYACQPVARPGAEAAWFATAVPTEPGETGVRRFAVNQEGTIYYRVDGPVEVDATTCAIATSAAVRPLGR